MILAALGWAGGFLLAATVLLVATPVHLAIRFDIGETTHWRIRAALFGGMAPLPTFSGDASATDISDKPDKDRLEPKSKRGSLTVSRGIRRAVELGQRLLCDLVRKIKLQALDADVTFGCADPGDTGALFGLSTPMIIAANRVDRAHLSLKPDFTQPALHGHVEGALRFVPLGVAISILVFAARVFAFERLRVRV